MRRPLRCYLLRPGASPGVCLTEAAAEKAKGYSLVGEAVELLESLHALNAPEPVAGQVLVVTMSSSVATPWWQELLAAELKVTDFAVGPLPSRGAIVFCATEDPAHEGTIRWVAWTFGIGSRSLRRTALEPRFGVISALNRIIGDGSGQALLRRLQYSQQGAYKQRTGHVASHGIPLGGFRMDRVRDLLAAVGGKPSDDDAQVFGGRNLAFRTDLTALDALRDETSAVMKVYRDEGYREHFSFIDNYIAIEDSALAVQLDERLLDAIAEGSDAVDVALPDDLVEFTDDRTMEYVLLTGERLAKASRTILTVDRIRSALSAEGAGLETEARFADADHNLVGHATLRECLSAELNVNGERYFLADGTYYDVRSEFIDAIDEALEAIPPWSIDLPTYGGGNERVWVQKAADSGDFAVLDGWLIRLPGRTAVEAADLVHSSGALIHAKRKGRSSSLSYLFVQASASSQLLSESPEAVDQFRSQVHDVAPEAMSAQVAAQLAALDQSRSGLDVVLAILGDWHQRGVRNLPLIAKLELRATVQAIEQRGFRPRLALVALDSRP